MSNPHHTTVDKLTTEAGQIRYAMWCETCDAGGDPHPDPITAAQDRDRHATDPDGFRPWAGTDTPTSRPAPAADRPPRS